MRSCGFDLSALSPALDILSAQLVLSVELPGEGDLAAAPLLGAWDELGVTYANQPGLAQPVVSAGIAQEIVLDITSLFLGWYRGARANHGVGVLAANEITGRATIVGARENPESRRRPRLIIVYYDPGKTTGAGDLPASAFVRAIAESDLLSSGAVRGTPATAELTSTASVQRTAPAEGAADLFGLAAVFQASDPLSAGAVRSQAHVGPWTRPVMAIGETWPSRWRGYDGRSDVHPHGTCGTSLPG